MSIDEFTQLIAPPDTPSSPGSPEQVTELESLVGTQLPSDYVEFGIRYGSGRFCNDFIRVFNPFSTSYKEWLDGRLDAMRSAAQRDGLGGYDVFPSRNGLLPWGDDENGNILCWVTQGEPDDWTVAVRAQGNGVEEWKLSFSTFLAKALQNQLEVSAWHEPFSDEELNFTSP